MADGGDGGPQRHSVISGPTGRRQWPDEVKARIVADSFVPGARVGDVARRHGVLPSQLTTWRRMAKDGHLALPWEGVGLSVPDFVPLIVEEDPSQNLHRFYRMEIAPGLFGDWALVREWGRVGQAGQVRIDWYDTEAAAKDVRFDILMKKAKRGYAYLSGTA